MKRCLVAYATRERQFLWPLRLADDATVQDALTAARSLAAAHPDGAPASAVSAGCSPGPPSASTRAAPVIPWDEASVGIFGEPCERSAVPRDGDRIEIYRPLRRDPRQARRERARRAGVM